MHTCASHVYTHTQMKLHKRCEITYNNRAESTVYKCCTIFFFIQGYPVYECSIFCTHLTLSCISTSHSLMHSANTLCVYHGPKEMTFHSNVYCTNYMKEIYDTTNTKLAWFHKSKEHISGDLEPTQSKKEQFHNLFNHLKYIFLTFQ